MINIKPLSVTTDRQERLLFAILSSHKIFATVVKNINVLTSSYRCRMMHCFDHIFEFFDRSSQKVPNMKFQENSSSGSIADCRTDRHNKVDALVSLFVRSRLRTARKHSILVITRKTYVTNLTIH